VQEFLVLQCAGVVLKPYELGVGNRCELAKAQVDAHDEWNDESNNECGERWQRKQRPPFPYRLASHADHSLPAFFPSPFRSPRHRGAEFLQLLAESADHCSVLHLSGIYTRHDKRHDTKCQTLSFLHVLRRKFTNVAMFLIIKTRCNIKHFKPLLL
jgi:hypothetical protein